jgi:hypothetical protein
MHLSVAALAFFGQQGLRRSAVYIAVILVITGLLMSASCCMCAVCLAGCIATAACKGSSAP